MERQHEPELTPDDLKALRGREESSVSVADDARIIQLLAARAGTPTRVHLVDGRVLEVINVAWGYDLDDPYAHVSTNISPSVDDTQSFPFEFFFTYSVSRISDPQDGAILFKPEAALQVDVADGLRPPLIGRELGGEIYGCPGCKK